MQQSTRLGVIASDFVDGEHDRGKVSVLGVQVGLVDDQASGEKAEQKCRAGG